jgi:putative transposase
MEKLLISKKNSMRCFDACLQHRYIFSGFQDLIQIHPTFGYRRLWAILRYREDYRIGRNTVYRLLKKNGWLVTNRVKTAKPRVKSSSSRTENSDQRWAMDMTHIPCGADGWGHLVAIIDCHDREIIGYEFSRRGRAKEAERALENACLHRFGTLMPKRPMPTIRSDNGLVFQSRRFRATCNDYKLSQEYITPYTPEQNGLIERFFRSLKEECTWQHNFSDFSEANRTVSRWLHWYNNDRPHQSLGYKSPRAFRGQKLKLVA